MGDLGVGFGVSENAPKPAPRGRGGVGGGRGGVPKIVKKVPHTDHPYKRSDRGYPRGGHILGFLTNSPSKKGPIIGESTGF